MPSIISTSLVLRGAFMTVFYMPRLSYSCEEEVVMYYAPGAICAFTAISGVDSVGISSWRTDAPRRATRRVRSTGLLMSRTANLTY